MSDLKYTIIMKLLTLPIVLISLTVHEISHGFAAYKLGDPTAKSLGRLSLNPLKHLDPIGALCMLFFGFGWAKPVPISTRYFKNPKRDMAITAVAGPVSNLLLGFVGMIIYKLVYYTANATLNPAEITTFSLTAVQMLLTFLYLFWQLNVALAVFNLIPIPPLDGSRVLLVFLPPKLYFGVMKYERIIMVALLALIYLGALDGVLGVAVGYVMTGMEWVVSFIPIF